MSTSIADIDAIVAGATAPRRFLELVAAHGDVPAVHSMKDATPGSWNAWTYTQVAEQVSMALANLTLQEALRFQSERDALTGLYNRRFMEAALERELSR